MLIGFAADLVLGAASMTYHAAFLLSMVFGYGGLFPLGFCDLPKWKPCLANMRHGCGVVEGCCCPTEVPIGLLCRTPAKHGFGGNLVAAGLPERGNHT